LPGPTETTTRKELIDPALQKAGWDVHTPNRVRLETPVDGFDLLIFLLSLYQKFTLIIENVNISTLTNKNHGGRQCAC
jgi:predicted type IV restriction endonuclease